MRRTRDFCITLRYVVSTDGKNKIGEAMRNQNTDWMPAACSMTRFLGASAARSVLLSFLGIEREWGRTANPEYNVLTTAEVIDMLPEMKLLHMTREIVRL